MVRRLGLHKVIILWKGVVEGRKEGWRRRGKNCWGYIQMSRNSSLAHEFFQKVWRLDLGLSQIVRERISTPLDES